MTTTADSAVLAKGAAFAVFTFVLMLSLGYAGGQQIANLNIDLPLSLENAIMCGMVMVVALAIPVLNAGMNGSVRYAMAFGSLSSFVLGILVYSVV